MTAEPLPAWAFPPKGGFTADDLDRIPDLPPHTELIDGSLVFVSPQKYFHMLAVDLLSTLLRQAAPAKFRVLREMTVVLNRTNRPEPDISIVRAEAVSEAADETGYQAADVVLAVEVVSPESAERDRKRKPQLYAEAGIPHFWRVEKGEGRQPVVYVYELDTMTQTYVPSGIHHERLKVPVPFTIDIDLTEIDRL
ncbi:Uma2 family endonuclease [Streptomyces sp. RKAG293]|uniref:Uma2 family endonuclease n=1 Tax=Streptomyces sp. RKAG293 TaxID=2893403 RepID=UPI002033841B|nr:Uma2 family endonuclease [Streptomyces sp. RKAG293]MCM2421828.1 Uma2 family endonuclease [Streptomyces sp. RKAG293]